MASLRCCLLTRSPWKSAKLPDGRRSCGGVLMMFGVACSFSLTVTWERFIWDGVAFASWQISSTPRTDMRYVQVRFALSPSFTRSSQRSVRLTAQLSDE